MKRKHSILLTLSLFTVIVFTGGDAAAQARHERVKVTPITSKGKVIGAKFAMTLRSEGGRSTVRIGLGPVGGLKESHIDDFRSLAADAAKGYLLHQFPEVTGLTSEAKEVSFKVLYKDVPGLKNGSEVEVISAWNNADSSSYWHVFGAVTHMTSQADSFKLPKTPKKPRKKAAARFASRGLRPAASARGRFSAAPASQTKAAARARRAGTGKPVARTSPSDRARRAARGRR